MLHKRLFALLAMITVLGLIPALAQNTVTLPTGTEIKVRTDQAIKGTTADAGKNFPATVSQDVKDNTGKVIIPRGARAQLKVVSENKQAALDLNSVTVNGQKYAVVSPAAQTGQVGANKTTAKYAGGGALAGAVIGAIAGGGKGAAIGGVLGGVAGAGTQYVTRGRKLNVPAETELSFKLAQELNLVPAKSTPSSRQKLPPAQQ